MGTTVTGFQNFMDGNGYEMPQKDIELCAIIYKNLWLRNSYVFQENFESPNIIMNRAVTQLEDFQAAQLITSKCLIRQPTPCDIMKWQLPKANIIKANWDAALNTQIVTSGLGGIFRDLSAELFTSFYSAQQLVKNLELVEALALRKVMLLSLDLDFHSLEFEGDYKKIIFPINSTVNPMSELGLVLYDI